MDKILIGSNVLFEGKIDKIKDTFSDGKEVVSVLLKEQGRVLVKNIDKFLSNALIIDLCYFAPKDAYSCGSIFWNEQQIAGDTYIEIFELFYKMNHELQYCYGRYFSFKDEELNKQYKLWLKSDDYNKKSFNLFYDGGVVD